MPRIKAILFDFMGTCLDWHSAVLDALPKGFPDNGEAIPPKADFALQWRQRYFDANAERVAHGLPPKDFDTMLRDVLLSGSESEDIKSLFSPEAIDRAISAWHDQKAWPDVRHALKALREKGYEIYVHANGTTRLQLDLCRSSGLQFDMLFSSELLGTIKPDPEAYRKGLELIRRKPEECVLVAAHAYDTRGAKAVGMKTVYVHRWSDDIYEDQEVVKGENDAWVESMEDLAEVVKGLGSS